MGSREYGGIRDVPGSLEWDAMLVRECQELAELLRGRGLDAGRLHFQVGLTTVEAILGNSVGQCRAAHRERGPL